MNMEEVWMHALTLEMAEKSSFLIHKFPVDEGRAQALARELNMEKKIHDSLVTIFRRLISKSNHDIMVMKKLEFDRFIANWLKCVFLMEVSVPHNMMGPSGCLRVSLMFNFYDRGDKGYLDQQNIQELLQDLYRVEHPGQRVGIPSASAKDFLNFANKQRVTLLEFYHHVRRQQIRGTSQILRINFGVPVCRPSAANRTLDEMVLLPSTALLMTETKLANSAALLNLNVASKPSTGPKKPLILPYGLPHGPASPDELVGVAAGYHIAPTGRLVHDGVTGVASEPRKSEGEASTVNPKERQSTGGLLDFFRPRQSEHRASEGASLPASSMQLPTDEGRMSVSAAVLQHALQRMHTANPMDVHRAPTSAQSHKVSWAGDMHLPADVVAALGDGEKLSTEELALMTRLNQNLRNSNLSARTNNINPATPSSLHGSVAQATIVTKKPQVKEEKEEAAGEKKKTTLSGLSSLMAGALEEQGEASPKSKLSPGSVSPKNAGVGFDLPTAAAGSASAPSSPDRRPQCMAPPPIYSLEWRVASEGVNLSTIEDDDEGLGEELAVTSTGDVLGPIRVLKKFFSGYGINEASPENKPAKRVTTPASTKENELKVFSHKAMMTRVDKNLSGSDSSPKSKENSAHPFARQPSVEKEDPSRQSSDRSSSLPVPERLLHEFEVWLKRSFGARYARRLPDEERARLFQAFNVHWTRIRLRAELLAQEKRKNFQLNSLDLVADGTPGTQEYRPMKIQIPVEQTLTQADLPPNVIQALLPKKRRDKLAKKARKARAAVATWGGENGVDRAQLLGGEEVDTSNMTDEQLRLHSKMRKRQQRQTRALAKTEKDGNLADQESGDETFTNVSASPSTASKKSRSVGSQVLSQAQSMGGVFTSPGLFLRDDMDEDHLFVGHLGHMEVIVEAVDPIDEVDENEFFYSSDSSVSDCSSISSPGATLIEEKSSLDFGTEVSSDDSRLRSDVSEDWGHSRKSSSSSSSDDGDYSDSWDSSSSSSSSDSWASSSSSSSSSESEGERKIRFAKKHHAGGENWRSRRAARSEVDSDSDRSDDAEPRRGRQLEKRSWFDRFKTDPLKALSRVPRLFRSSSASSSSSSDSEGPDDEAMLEAASAVHTARQKVTTLRNLALAHSSRVRAPLSQDYVPCVADLLETSSCSTCSSIYEDLESDSDESSIDEEDIRDVQTAEDEYVETDRDRKMAKFERKKERERLKALAASGGEPLAAAGAFDTRKNIRRAPLDPHSPTASAARSGLGANKYHPLDPATRTKKKKDEWARAALIDLDVLDELQQPGRKSVGKLLSFPKPSDDPLVHAFLVEQAAKGLRARHLPPLLPISLEEKEMLSGTAADPDFRDQGLGFEEEEVYGETTEKRNKKSVFCLFRCCSKAAVEEPTARSSTVSVSGQPMAAAPVATIMKTPPASTGSTAPSTPPPLKSSSASSDSSSSSSSSAPPGSTGPVSVKRVPQTPPPSSAGSSDRSGSPGRASASPRASTTPANPNSSPLITRRKSMSLDPLQIINNNEVNEAFVGPVRNLPPVKGDSGDAPTLTSMLIKQNLVDANGVIIGNKV